MPDEAESLVPGAVVELCLGNAGVEFLLCANVGDDQWICTRGHFIEDMFQVSDPFGAPSLVLKRIQRDAWCEDKDVLRKRVPPHLRRGHLRQVAESRPDHWDAAVAIATWRAEVMKAELEGRFVNEQQAISAFEHDPFQWDGAPRRLSRASV
eukprot:12423212-Karenia_brevis.AAC.1